ncbi:MAG: hypothetical protein MRJ92_04965 [Nitrospira sp.]|nr:hypothetical protein [Nitrospira sp.]
MSDVYLKVVDLHHATVTPATVNILVVVDGQDIPDGSSLGVGVGRVVRLLRESHVGCTHFSVDLARQPALNLTTIQHRTSRGITVSDSISRSPANQL